MQEVVLIGNIGKDPEMKYFESGKCNVNFSIAVGRYDFQKKEKVTDWYNVVAWEKLAERIGEHFTKGKSVYVVGTLKKETYKSQSGEEKTAIKVTATDIGYSSALATVSGEVFKVENRFTSDNKKIQTIHLKDNDAVLINTNDKIEATNSQFLTALCQVKLNDKEIIGKALKIDVVDLKYNTSANKEELEADVIDTEEIPF